MLILLFYFLAWSLLFVGPIQLIGFIIRVCNLKGKSVVYKNRLMTYGKIILSYGLTWLIVIPLIKTYSLMRSPEFEILFFSYLFIVPALIAIYYWSIIYKKYETNTTDLTEEELDNSDLTTLFI